MSVMLPCASWYLALAYLKIPEEGFSRSRIAGKTEAWNLTFVITDLRQPKVFHLGHDNKITKGLTEFCLYSHG